ncbi:hypothetical protein PROFUN_05832 [Planoprotostelium fungivorum]|uniref:Uncharacterized protein n=1 Tax=Planoprotostelium fungivorum TaxID=1890364 RepID=A0A2P6NKK1_9EUKA|nr:hypothetical protein PROFUN_05832 [Planoprotostelium fungivorum]
MGTENTNLVLYWYQTIGNIFVGSVTCYAGLTQRLSAWIEIKIISFRITLTSTHTQSFLLLISPRIVYRYRCVHLHRLKILVRSDLIFGLIRSESKLANQSLFGVGWLKGASPGIEPESAKARHSNKRLGFTTPPLERPDYTNPRRPEGSAFCKF